MVYVNGYIKIGQRIFEAEIVEFNIELNGSNQVRIEIEFADLCGNGSMTYN